MRQSRADNVLAIGLAILVHVLLFGLIFLGALWSASSRPESAMGSPISADLFDPDALSAADRRALATRPAPLPEPEPEPVPEPLPEPVEPQEEPVAPPPQPLPEPVPEDAVEERQPELQDVIPDPDTVSQEAVKREAEAAEQREREQEEKRRQAQIELEAQRKQEEAEEKRRLAQQQLENIRKQREQAARQARLAEERLKQISDREARQASDQRAASATPPPGQPTGDSGLAAKYAAALQEAIRRNWRRPDNVPLGQRCRIYITQLPGGEVMSVEFDASCPYDAQGRRSVEAAVLAAQPLPYAGFEPVFNRRLNLNFTAQD